MSNKNNNHHSALEAQQQPPKRTQVPSIKKQNAISVTVTPDKAETPHKGTANEVNFKMERHSPDSTTDYKTLEGNINPCSPAIMTTTSDMESNEFRKPISSLSTRNTRNQHNIPNLFFTKLQSIEDTESGDDVEVIKQKADSSALQSPRLPRGLQSQQQQYLQNPIEFGQENYSISASSSPRINRRLEYNTTQLDNSQALTIPSSPKGRKLSLQPSQMVQSEIGTLNVINQHQIPRKSVIGRLERSSFQEQRLSDVGIAFGQQITAKMGLKLPASQERIVEQTRWLYLRYIFIKLRQNSLPLRDLNLTKSSRARRAAALGDIDHKNSSSAPASALPDYSGPNFLSSSRKRQTLIGSTGSQDISTLAAKMRAFKVNNHDASLPATILDASSTLTAQTNGNSSSSKKFIMDSTINAQIFAVIMKVIKELRDIKPEFYGDTIYEQIGIDKFSSLQSLLSVQMTICQEMTRSEISWCRIAALFSLFGAMSLDCVRLGAPEHVGPILDGFIQFVERDLALWISQQGGWESFLYKCRAGLQFGYPIKLALSITLPIFVYALFCVSRSIA